MRVRFPPSRSSRLACGVLVEGLSLVDSWKYVAAYGKRY